MSSPTSTRATDVTPQGNKPRATPPSTHGDVQAERSTAPLGVFIRLYSYPIPRVKRMMTVAREIGCQPIFLGAHREPDLPRSEIREGWSVERVGSHFPLVNGRRPLLYAWSVFRYAVALFVRLVQLRPTFVHVSDFEPYWPARIYTALAGIPLLYNIHDNLAQRYACGRVAAGFLNVLEGVAVKAASLTLVPEDFRATALPRWCQSNVAVIRNTPIDPGYVAPRAFKPGKDDVRLFYAGWLDSGRGLSHALGMVRTTPKLGLTIAGSGDAELVAETSATERVECHGYLRHEEVMRLTAESDYVVALYDPIRPINRFAASNKIAEALAIGRPPIINREMKIAQFLEPYRCAVICDYDQASTIGEELVHTREDLSRYLELCRNARQVYEAHYAWPKVRAASVAAFRRAGVRVTEPEVEHAAA